VALGCILFLPLASLQFITNAVTLIVLLGMVIDCSTISFNINTSPAPTEEVATTEKAEARVRQGEAIRHVVLPVVIPSTNKSVGSHGKRYTVKSCVSELILEEDESLHEEMISAPL
jgi:hypothetical protein